MNEKLKLFDRYSDFKEAEKQWDENEKQAALSHPIKKVGTLPKMVGITEDTRKFLKWKSFKWMVTHDKDFKVLKGFLKHPIKYTYALISSLLKNSPFTKEGDFFFYGVFSLLDFEELLSDPKSLLVVGFSYCHKPFECPSGRFTPDCIHDPSHPVCRQCFIGKAQNALPKERTIPLVIPTVHYIGGEILEIVNSNPEKKVIFMITACEMTLQMFADYGNMAGIKGIGVRLDGRICNTMRAFDLSEQGIKPGLTVVLEPTQKTIMRLIEKWRAITSISGG